MKRSESPAAVATIAIAADTTYLPCLPTGEERWKGGNGGFEFGDERTG
jgi:hypothetical protein